MFWIIFAAQYVLGGIALTITLNHFNRKRKIETEHFFDDCNEILRVLNEFPLYGLDAYGINDYTNIRISELEEEIRFLLDAEIIEKVDVGTRDPIRFAPVRIKK